MSQVWTRVLVIGLMPLIVGACARHRSEQPAPRSDCAVPDGAVAFDSTKIERLAGDYRLIFVSDSYPIPNASRPAELHLAIARDTLRRFYRYSSLGRKWHQWGERPLVGWLEGELEELHASWSGDPRSEDPDAPGVYYEQAYGEFIIGRVPELMDGASTSMQVAWMAEDSFGGRWEPDLGLVIVLDSATGRRLVFGGHYCAWRL
jgi:hypothetical protein